MRAKAIIVTIFASLLIICASAASSEAFGQTRRSQVNHPRGYIGPPIAQNYDPRRVPPRPDSYYRKHRRAQIAKNHNWYGYRNYGQYRRTQVGKRRHVTLWRPSWADRHR